MKAASAHLSRAGFRHRALSRRFTYEGKAVFSRTVKADVLRRLTDGGQRVFLDN
jgi:hypothetical protein